MADVTIPLPLSRAGYGLCWSSKISQQGNECVADPATAWQPGQIGSSVAVDSNSKQRDTLTLHPQTQAPRTPKRRNPGTNNSEPRALRPCQYMERSRGGSHLRPARPRQGPHLDRGSVSATRPPRHCQGLLVLGTPLGTDEYVHGILAASGLTRIPEVPDLQAAWRLLHYCAGPRANYLLRNVPPALTAQFAADCEPASATCLGSLVRSGDQLPTAAVRTSQVALRSPCARSPQIADNLLHALAAPHASGADHLAAQGCHVPTHFATLPSASRERCCCPRLGRMPPAALQSALLTKQSPSPPRS